MVKYNNKKKKKKKKKSSVRPELVVGVSHLMSSEFRHQDFNNSDEYEEVNLRKDQNRNQCNSSQHDIQIIKAVMYIIDQVVYKCPHL